MKERMDDIWERAREKQSLQEAAHRLRKERRSPRLKLSVSAAFGLMIALLPIAGAAQGVLILF